MKPDFVGRRNMASRGEARPSSPSVLNKPACRTALPLGLCISAAVCLVPSIVKAADDDAYCADYSCVRNANGAFGLMPSRTYRAVMSDDDSVCSEVVRDMNGAITGHVKPWQTIPGSLYDNPLYSGTSFLRWNHLKGEPGSHALHDPAKDDSGYRWMVSPVFNDSQPVLVTTFASILVDGKRMGEISEFWHIEPSQAAIDWSDPASYSGMEPLTSRIKSDESGLNSPVRVEPGDDPLERTTTLYKYSHYPNENLNYLPKLPLSAQSGLWRRVARLRSGIGNEISFAMIGGVYYTLLNSGRYDVFLVFRLHPDRVGDDVCYLESDLSQKLWRE